MKSLFRHVRRGEPIVVVTGLPRSGTSMVMKMLDEGGMPVAMDDVRRADTNNPLGYFELEQVKKLGPGGETRWLTDVRGKAVKIVSPLLTYLPESYDYQVVFIRRDLGEVLASQNAMLDARQEPRGPADDRMRAYYEQHLEQVERFLVRRPCFSTLEVQYAAILANPREQAARIAAFLDRELDVSRMAAVVDAALYRCRL